MAELPYGSWPSPLTADLVAGGSGPRLTGVAATAAGVRWLESRPGEGGRSVVVALDEQGAPVDVTPPGSNARSRVHEYGGGAVWFHGESTFFSEFADSRVYRVDGGEARPITPEPAEPHAQRFADGCVTPDGATIVCVRERHEGATVENELVAFAADGSSEPRVVASGRDFYAAPRIDPSGRRLAWLSWDHPQMPWDGTELCVGDLTPEGTIASARLVAGGSDESVLDPQWSPDGELYFCSDRNGWWNLYRGGDAVTSFDDAEIGLPAWVFGLSRYAFLEDGRVACIVTRQAVDSLAIASPATGELERVDLDWTHYVSIASHPGDHRLLFVAASPTTAACVVSLDPATGAETVVRRSLELDLDSRSISVPRAIDFPTGDGGRAHAFFYPPTSADHEAPAGELPPLRVICHGGPTSHTSPELDVETQFFTQRGIGVVDVNYRGSTGYGRAYRRLLRGRWGEIDWQDCVAAARSLAAAGEADAERTWVEGGSAGGYVVLCALVFDPTAFAAGVSYFGVADAEALALDTHKFESRYLDSMIGPYPERRDVYRERSPVHFVDRLERPLLLLQGLDDEVVPPSQAEMMVDVLARKGIPFAYVPFAGEGHGFRRRESIRRSLEATLSFVGQVFGFEPADELEPLALT